MSEQERRRWMRHEHETLARLHVNEDTYARSLSDISGSGAAIRGINPTDEKGRLKIKLEQFGEFTGSVVRDWDDGFAVAFDTSEDDQYSLQEDIESFMRENDLYDA